MQADHLPSPQSTPFPRIFPQTQSRVSVGEGRDPSSSYSSSNTAHSPEHLPTGSVFQPDNVLPPTPVRPHHHLKGGARYRRTKEKLAEDAHNGKTRRAEERRLMDEINRFIRGDGVKVRVLERVMGVLEHQEEMEACMLTLEDENLRLNYRVAELTSELDELTAITKTQLDTFASIIAAPRRRPTGEQGERF